MPFIEQVVVGAQAEGHIFDRILYLIRRRFTEETKRRSNLKQAEMIYVCSLNTRVIVYKGMLTPSQLFPFYADLEDSDYESHLAMVHSRFSTNTFPSWDRAQPKRFMSHNGEINTLRGNKNMMTARQGVVHSSYFGDDIKDLFPIAEPDFSDSGTFDNVLEFMLMSGRSLQEAVMMMIPEAWQADENMPQAKKDFYEFHSALMEPWDGPASIAFTDGHYIGAVLDRCCGLDRPGVWTTSRRAAPCLWSRLAVGVRRRKRLSKTAKEMRCWSRQKSFYRQATGPMMPVIQSIIL